MDKGELKLDVKPGGITAAQLQVALRKILNKENATITVEASGQTSSGLVRNGASVTVTSENEILKYTIIIMGDVNCNGETDAGDMGLMRKHFQGVRTLTGAALTAADTSQNGEIDAGDMVRNRMKFQNWNSFKTVSGVIRVDE